MVADDVRSGEVLTHLSLEGLYTDLCMQETFET